MADKGAIGLTLALAVLGLVAVPHASAAGLGMQYEGQASVALANSLGSVEVTCADGRNVLGGGAFSNGDYAETSIDDSYPIDGPDKDSKADDGWRVTIWNTASTARNIEVLAICSKLKPKLRSAPSVSGNAAPELNCPNGTRPVGGGVESGGTFANPTNVIFSRPQDSIDDDDSKPDDGWYGYVAQPDFMEFPGNNYVLCLKSNLAKVKYRPESIPVGPEAQAGNTADCREGERLFGIGAATNSAIMTIVRMIGADGPDADLELDDGVSASVDNNLTFERSGTVVAICGKKR
jgi:hypothetical protein